MRDELITYLKTLDFGTISVSEELPYTKDAAPLYLSNYKKIYVDRPLLSQEAAINTFDGGSLVNQTTTITAYLVLDAKTTVSNYDSIISLMQAARNGISDDRRISRTCTISQSYEVDALVTEFTFSFIELLT
jgi:hypothetical protein